MDIKGVGSSRRNQYLRVLAALGLWFSLMLFLMAAVSLRRFTTPAAALDDIAPAATAPAATVAPTAAPIVDRPTANALRQSRDSGSARQPSKPRQPAPAPLDSARQTKSAKPQLRSAAGTIQPSRSPLATTYARLPLSFEPNQGQTAARVKFLARGSGYTLFLTDNEAALALHAEKKVKAPGLGARDLETRIHHSAAGNLAASTDTSSTTVLRMQLVGANHSPAIRGVDQLSGRSSYFIGNDPSHWRTDIPTYAKVRYQRVYPGVDLVYYGNQGQLEYDFVLAPGADPRAIGLSISGAAGEQPLDIDAEGNLVVHMTGGEVRLHKPVVYQADASQAAAKRHFIDARYVLEANQRVAFQLGGYDASKPLVIDPTLSYSTYLGGSGSDAANAIAVDSSGNAYVTGNTTSVDFPGSPANLCGAGSHCGTANGFMGVFLNDVFVAKLNPSASGASSLIYSAYLGGSADDFGFGIAVDSSGNAYVTGQTNSTDFPKVSPIGTACVGSCGTPPGAHAFVAKVGAGGSTLVYSTLLGGSTSDTGEAIAVDSSSNAYVAGLTDSSDFPQANNASTGGCAGTCSTKGATAHNAFVAQITSATPPALGFSTLLGSSGEDDAFGIALDSSANVYVTGITKSSDFPQKNPIAAACNGISPATCGTGKNEDVFVTELKADGSPLLFSTYLGGSANDEGLAIAVDSSGAVYVTGDTSSIDFPKAGTVTGACPALSSCGTGGTVINAFVTKLKTGGSDLAYSTYLGGSTFDMGFGIAVDSSGSATVTGLTTSSDFPAVNAVTGACVGTCGGAGTTDEAFVTQVNAAGTGLGYSTFLGGSNTDLGAAVAVDSKGNAYVAGATSSANFPTTGSAYQTKCGGPSSDGTCGASLLGGPFSDAFVTKIASGLVDTTPPAIAISANPSLIHLRNGSFVPVTVSGTITDSDGGVNAGTAAFAVVDEYGLVQPSGGVGTLGADGSYSFVVMLQASRNGSDLDGRQYTITVSAQDNAGNRGSASTVVTVLHNN